MTIAVLGDEVQQKEFSSHTFPDSTEVIYADSLQSLLMIEADMFFDLQFEYDPERIAILNRPGIKPVIVNSVVYTCREIGGRLTRINAWPTQLGRPVAELALPGENEQSIRDLFQSIGWEMYTVPDVTGMITPRVIAMIINEAAFALSEGISTREEIDLAMKLGTNYPYGPFEWLDKIGINRISELLRELNRNGSRYTIAPMLQKPLL